MRVHELAKELNISAKELIESLKKDGVDVKNHMSALTEDVVAKWLKKGAAAGGHKAKESVQDVKLEPKKKKAGKKAAASEEPAKETKPVGTSAKGTEVEEVPAAAIVEEETGDDEEEYLRKFLGDRKKKKKFSKKKKPKIQEEAPVPVIEKKTTNIYIGEEIQVKKFAELLGIPLGTVLTKLIEMGMMVTPNQNIDRETAEIVGHEFGIQVFKEEEQEKKEEQIKAEAREAIDARFMVEKAPVVTFMGHVDHGKTSLLDYIRKSKVAATEAGQITQHIGAYEVTFNNKPIVFLDTPGHKAFTAMRARGANATDIVVLVVAADDGIMEQTKEAISHANAAKVPIIVAINKIDKNTANVERVLRQLSEINLMPEDWGGTTICVRVSAISGEGVDHLLEMILLQAEMMELKANPRGPGKGIVIESKMTRGRGPTITVLIQRGTLRVGDPVICEANSGKVKSIINDRGEAIKEAGPAKPVEVLGLEGVPDAGSILESVTSDKDAKRIAEDRGIENRKVMLEQVNKPTTLEEFYQKIEAEEGKELKIIIKGDVHGSTEALSQSLEELSNEKVAVHVVHKAVGDVSESDVMLASASNAIIIGFCIRVDKRARELAKKEGVQIKTYNIIYEAIDDIYQAMGGMLGTKLVEQYMGSAEVRETFSISKLGVIAGCYVQDGKVIRNAKVRVKRDGEQLFEGNIDTLRRFKDEAKEVRSGMECGIKLDGFNDIAVGDKLEFYTLERVALTW